MRRIIIFLLLILLFGCIKREPVFLEYAKIVGTEIKDIDKDGKADRWKYRFAPLEIEKNLILTRTIIIEAHESVEEKGENETVAKTNYEVSIFLEIWSKNLTSVFTTLSIAEEVPPQLTTNINDIIFIERYTGYKEDEKGYLTLIWELRDIGSGEGLNKTIIYRATTKKALTEWLGSIKNPKITVVQTDPRISLWVRNISSVGNEFLSALILRFGFYVGVSLFGASLCIALLLLWDIFELTIKSLRCIKNRLSIKNMIRSEFKEGIKDYSSYTVVILLLFILGFVAISTDAKEIRDTSNILKILLESPIPTVGMALWSLGFIFLFLFIEDITIKGLLGMHKLDLSFLKLKKAKPEEVSRCPSCGRDIPSSTKICLYCKTNIPSFISENIKYFINELSSLKEQIAPIKHVSKFESEEKDIQNILIELRDVEEKVKINEFEGVVLLLSTLKSRFERLKEGVIRKIELYKNISEGFEIIENIAEELDKLFLEGKEAGAKLAEEEAEYKSLCSDYLHNKIKIKGLCENGEFEEAMNRANMIKKRYETMKKEVLALLQAHKEFSKSLSHLNQLLPTLENLFTQSKKLGINISSEEKKYKEIQERLKPITEKGGNLKELTQLEDIINELIEYISKKQEIYHLLFMRSEELEKKIKESSELIARCISQNIDVSSEYKELKGIEFNKIKSMLESCEDFEGAKNLLDEANSITEKCILNIKERLNYIENWGAWKSYIDSLLKSQDRISGDELPNVPEEWKEWALQRYVSENLKNGIIFEKGAIVKLSPISTKKQEIEKLLRRLAKTKIIEGCMVIRRDGIALCSTFEGNEEILSMEGGKIIEAAKRLSSDFNKGEIKHIVIYTPKYKLIGINVGRAHSLISTIKPTDSVIKALKPMLRLSSKLVKLFEEK